MSKYHIVGNHVTAHKLTLVTLDIFDDLHSSPIFILLTCNIRVVIMYYQPEWKTVWLLIRWLHQMPADLNLQCFLKINPGSEWPGLTRCRLQTVKTQMKCHRITIFCGNYNLWLLNIYNRLSTGPHSAVCNMSDNRWESDCRSRGHEFDPGPVPFFRGDWSWNNFFGHSPPFRWIIQEGLLSVTSKSMCRKYWLTACSSLPRIKWA